MTLITKISIFVPASGTVQHFLGHFGINAKRADFISL
jgi:hypothetical protein